MNAKELKREASLKGHARTEQAGWSIVLTRPGSIPNDNTWMLSGKRKNGARPNDINLQFLRKFAIEIGAPEDVSLEQRVADNNPGGGTWFAKWDPAPEEMEKIAADVAAQAATESSMEALQEGMSWTQAMDPIDPRFAIVTMRFPTEGMPLATYDGKEAGARMVRFAQSFLAGMAAQRMGGSGRN